MILNIDRLVIIHIDTLRREYSYCYLIKKGFEQLGYRVFLVSRRNFKAILSIISPEILVISHCHDSQSDFIKKISDKTNIYNVPVECLGDEKYMYPLMYPEDFDLRSIKGIFLWSNYFREWLINNREIDPEKVYCSGSPRVSMSKYVEKKKTNVIGFIGRFEFLNNFQREPALQSLLMMTKQRKHFLQRSFAEIEGVLIYIELIDYLINNGYKVSIRPHPQERILTYDVLKEKYKGKLAIDDGVDFLGWLESVDLVVATISTSLTETYLTGTPIISVDSMFKENYMKNYEKWTEKYMSIAYTPSSMDETKELFKKDLNGKQSHPEMDEFLERFYGIKGGEGFDGLENIVRVIHQERIKNNKIPWIRYMFGRVIFLFLDIILLMKSYYRKSIYREFYYNYCCFWNKPSSFMKTAAAKFVASLK